MLTSKFSRHLFPIMLGICSSGVWGQKAPSGSTPKKTPPPKLSSKSVDPGTNWTPPNWPVPRLDDQKLRSHGIRKLAGTHLVLYTDVPPSPDVDELAEVFDQAVPQWCQYFGVDVQSVLRWHLVGFLIKDKDRFAAANAIRSDIPKFLHGYQFENELWVYEQSSSYYRRHLLLHEGTHAFMNWRLGGAGPPWYMEGVAELLATHQWKAGKLTIRHFPGVNDEVPDWGRIRIIKDAVKADKGLSLEEVMRYDERAHLRVEPYGWCWAAAAFFDHHPRWQVPFRELRSNVSDRSTKFNSRFYAQLKPEWNAVRRDWQWFTRHIDFGYDIARSAVDPHPVQNLPSSGHLVKVLANRGWQSSGVKVRAGETYRITASGRFELRDSPRAWPCEPNGVTIRYYRGLPLGVLVGGVWNEEGPPDDDFAQQNPIQIGLGTSFKPDKSGTLMLRLNDSPSELQDNSGFAQVSIKLD